MMGRTASHRGRLSVARQLAPRPIGGPRDDPAVETGEARMLRLQRLAGNRAVTQLIGGPATGHPPAVVQRRPEDEEQPPADPSSDAATKPAPDPPTAGADAAAPAEAPSRTAPTSPSNEAAAPVADQPKATDPPAPGASTAGPKPTPDAGGVEAAGTKPASTGTGAAGAGAGAVAAAAGPSFARDAGLDLEATAAPTDPVARTFTADEKATLPAKEPEPDISFITADQPFWNDAAAKAFAEKLAEAYSSRGLTTGVKVDKAAKLTELQQDFDDVVKGFIFGRSGYQLPFNKKTYASRWAQLPNYLASVLQAKRAVILQELQAANNKLKKDQRASKEDLDRQLELRMQKERFETIERLRKRVAIGTWGWMAERREKVDFDTIKQKPTGKSAKLDELLTTDEMRVVISGILATHKKSLTDAEKDKAIETAQNAKDAAAKKAKQESAALTDDEKASAVAAAEHIRLKANNWDGELKLALIKARTTKDEANLVVPTQKDVKGWQEPKENPVRIHKDLVALLKVLESEYKPGFRAGTYKLQVEGDHASAGFQGRFKSLDMYPNGGAAQTQTGFGEAGFFDKQIAYDFARAIDRAVEGKGTFQILYNDFVVARELNKVLKNGRMMNIDNVTADAGGAANLNWHGPLVTHFHVDFAI